MAGLSDWLCVSVCCLSEQSNWAILQFTGLMTVRLELKKIYIGVYVTVAKVVIVCHSLIRSQLEYDRGQVYVACGHVFIVV